MNFSSFQFCMSVIYKKIRTTIHDVEVHVENKVEKFIVEIRRPNFRMICFYMKDILSWLSRFVCFAGDGDFESSSEGSENTKIPSARAKDRRHNKGSRIENRVG